jgi:peptidyl-prolyl cis-trans isomerase A (cyclophilin A)
MNRRFVPLVLLALAAAPAPKPPLAPPPEIVRVALTTSAGVITLELEAKKAPVTTANFLRYVDQKRFDGTVFYRAMKLGDGTQGLIQGGTQNDPKRIFKPIAHEPTSVTGVKHITGAISMARWEPGTATGDFSILLSPMPALDANPGGSGDAAGYAAFGHVVEGMDVVKKIHAGPVSAIKGEGFMKGQMLEPTMKILTVRRVKIITVPLAHVAPPARPADPMQVK